MTYTKRICVFFVALSLVIVNAFTYTSVARADDELSLSQLIDLFVSLNIIPADKAVQARAALADLETRLSVCTSVQLTQNLALGSTDKGAKGEVTKLQTFLAGDPSLYPEAVISGFYGPATTKAVQRFQLRYKIVTASGAGYGSVGPLTRSVLAECYHRSAGITTSSSAKLKPVVSIVYPASYSVYPNDQRITIAVRVQNTSAALSQARFYISGGVYKSTWHELDIANLAGEYATLTLPSDVVALFGTQTPYKVKVEFEEWEAGAFVKKAEATMGGTFSFLNTVAHVAYYTTGVSNAERMVYGDLLNQAREFGGIYNYVGVDRFDIDGDGQDDVLGFINTAPGSMCGSKGCRFSITLNGTSTAREAVFFDTLPYRTTNGAVMILRPVTGGHNDIAFLSTSGRYDLWRWDTDTNRYVFGRTTTSLPNSTVDTNNNNNNNNDNGGGGMPPPPPPPPPI